MFFSNDYPDWAEKMHEDAGCGDFHIETEVWDLVKNQDEKPHLGNAKLGVMFNDIREQLLELSDDINVTFEINGMASYLYINNESIYSWGEAKEVINELKEDDE